MDLQTLSRRPFAGIQRGAASVAIAMLIMLILAAAVAASMIMSGSSVRDAATNEEQIAALFLAESGLERAMGILRSAASSDTMSGSVCEDEIKGTYPLGRGNFDYVSATASPNKGCTGAECTGCSVRVTGNVITDNVLTASRTLNLKINLGVDNGVSGIGNQVIMNLKNFYNVPATVVFNLAWRRKGCESNDSPDCIDPQQQASASTSSGSQNCVGCRWWIESSNGDPSVGSMGVTAWVDANQIVPLPVTQYLGTNRSYAEVAGLFPGVSGDPNTPKVIGSYGYWDDSNQGTKDSNSAASSSGRVTNGVANATDVCVNPYDAVGTYVPAQSCKSWCYSADTLALGISGRVKNPSASASSFGPVTFNDVFPMKSIAHFERTDMFTDVLSEIWYAYNPNYPNPPSNLSPPAYSGGVVTGAIGVTTFSGDTTDKSPTLTVSAPSDNLLAVGDIISCTNPCPIPNNTTITAIAPGGGAGIYTLSKNATNTTLGKSMQAARSSNVLSVTAWTSGYLSVGDTITGAGISNGTTIQAVGTGLGGTGVTGTGNATLGTYILNNLQTVSPTSITTAGSTINVPAGTIAPTADTVLAVYSGSSTGTFAPNTTVSAILTSNPTSFKVSATPTTMLSGATICGGICALFNAPNSSSSNTNFTIARTNVDQWAAGFTCLSGVDKGKIKAVTTSKANAGTWNEVVK